MIYAVTRSCNRFAIEAAMPHVAEAENIKFIYHDVRWPRRYPNSGGAANLVYSLWQRSLMRTIRVHHEMYAFDVAHHLTFGSWRQPSALWKLGIPFIFGPVGGGEEAPPQMVAAMPWSSRRPELLRNLWNRLALFNPALRKGVAAARLVPAKTHETAAYISRLGGASYVSLEIGIGPAGSNTTSPRNKNEALKCLYVGRLVEWKGIRLAIDAITRARANGTNVTLTIVGTGPLREELESLVAARSLTNAVLFVGALPQPQVFSMYGAHHIKLFPSLHDSSGNVVLEALAFGLPVVCLALGGPYEIVNDDCGIAVPCNNRSWANVAEDLSGELITLANDEPRRLRLMKGAITRASEMTWDAAVARVYDTFDNTDN